MACATVRVIQALANTERQYGYMQGLAYGAKRDRLTKQVDVFGLYIYATNTTGDDKIPHAAQILAEYINRVLHNSIL
jgi:hypothetical protein